MKDKRSEVILSYEKKRESLTKMAYLLFIIFLAIISLSRVRTGEGGFELELPLLDSFTIDTGDLVVFGPLAIFVMVLWFDRTFTRCLEMRTAIIHSYADPSFSKIEHFFLKMPLESELKNPWKWLNHLQVRFVYFFGFVSIVSLLVEYFRFRPKDVQDGSFWHVLIGHPLFQGFEPHWPRFSEVDVVWIYPPWYPICYLIFLSFLAYRTWRPPSE